MPITLCLGAFVVKPTVFLNRFTAPVVIVQAA